MKKAYLLAGILCLTALLSCSSDENSTKNIATVRNINLKRYMGKWYEIARFDHRFERELEKVTAEYKLLENGKISVLNRGFNPKKQKWSEADATARIPDNNYPGILKVSFFPLISGDYRIIALDTENYEWAIVTSSSKKYLWLLARTPHIDDELYGILVEKAKNMGFETQNLIKVKH